MADDVTGGVPGDDGQDDAVLQLEQFLPYRLSVLSNTVSRAIARDYQRRFGLSIPQWRVMAVLGRFPDLSANEVADKTAMDKVMVSRAVSALLKDGRLERRSDPADRRRSVLRLSPAGRGVYRQIVPVALAHEARLLSVLDAADVAALDRLLGRLQATGEGLAGSSGDTRLKSRACRNGPPRRHRSSVMCPPNSPELLAPEPARRQAVSFSRSRSMRS